MKKGRNNRKKIFHRAVGILLSGSLALGAPISDVALAASRYSPYNPAAEAGQEEEAENLHSAYEEETGPSQDTVYEETGFSYRLCHENAAGTFLPGMRRAGMQEPSAEITAYSGTDTEITIPGIIGGKEVKSIGKGAFKGNADITRVTIAEGITSIGCEAFSGCENLTAVSVPSTVTNWNDTSGNNYESRAFENCTALSELTLAEGLKILGQKAFQGCTSLERVTVPSTIEECHDKVFSGCSALKSLELREGIRKIGYRAFEGCTALEEVTIPSTIEGWGTVRASGIMAAVYDCAPFADCTSLKKITFNEGLKTLWGFQGSRGCPLVTELDIPASVEDISYAFTDCTSLEKVTLHDGMEAIGTNAFKGCTALREVSIPNTVTTLMANAFRGCSSLERLVFPPSAVKLEGGVTDGCSSLKELYLLAEAVKWYQTLGMPSDGRLYCVEGSSTYATYLAGMPESIRNKLTAVPATGVEAEGQSLTYDGSPHQAAAVKGTQEGDEILYRMDGGKYQENIPQVTEPGSYTVEIMVKRLVPGEPMQYSGLRVQTLVSKRQHSIRLQDIEAEEGEPYEIAVQGYGGTGEVTYMYYQDAACTLPCGGKPEAAGEYYVRASVPETDYDAAVESNAAKITIRGKGTSGSDPSTSSRPGTDPGNNPSSNPSASPGTNPSTNPSTSPDVKPSTPPGATQPPQPSRTPGRQDSTGLAKGSVFTAGKLQYKVTEVAKGKAAVQVKAPASKKAKSLTIPATVKKNGVSYSVTSVGASAFRNCKKLKKITIGKNVTTIGKNAFSGAKALKSITVKTAKLKKIGKNALKGIHKKAVIKVPKKKLKKYRKLWKKKGQKGTVKIK